MLLALIFESSVAIGTTLKISEYIEKISGFKFGKNIGLAYVETSLGSIGNSIDIQVRQRFVPAKIIETPFYKRNRTHES